MKKFKLIPLITTDMANTITATRRPVIGSHWHRCATAESASALLSTSSQAGA